MDLVVGALRLLGMGWYVAAAVILGVAGGVWLDNILGTTPMLTLLGLGLGLAAAVWGGYKMVIPLLGETKRKNS